MKTMSFNGVELSLVEIQKNKQLTCKKDCWNADSCDLKRAVALKPDNNKFGAVLVTMNVKNYSSKGWSIELENWELIDTDGFAYRAHNMCDNLRPPRLFEAGRWTVSPGTQVNFMLVFPELENYKDIAKILHVSDGKLNSIDIKGLKDDVAKLFEAKEKAIEQESIENDWELRQLRDSIERLDALIYSRLNNILIPKEIQRIENSIQNEFYRIEQKLKTLSQSRQNLFRTRFEEMINSYNLQVEERRIQERKVVDLNKKVSALYELTPRDFEEYIAELFKTLGYDNVNLTPLSNDKGIDILMEKGSKRYAVQCKKFKGMVGSPAIQTFIGAMEHAQASHGFFVTTSTFSIEAEKMASEHPIELIDNIKLGQLIEQALGLG